MSLKNFQVIFTVYFSIYFLQLVGSNENANKVHTLHLFKSFISLLMCRFSSYSFPTPAPFSWLLHNKCYPILDFTNFIPVLLLTCSCVPSTFYTLIVRSRGSIRFRLTFVVIKCASYRCWYTSINVHASVISL